jgi:hypothetical protein
MSAHAATADGHHAAGAPVSAYHESLLRSPVFLGMIMFLGSEIMLFGSFFTIFFYMRFTHSPWPPEGMEIPKEATGINTAILISSSFTMHWALVSIKRDQRFGLVVGLFLTLAMGLTFLSLQVHEYLNLGFVPARHACLRRRDAPQHRLPPRLPGPLLRRRAHRPGGDGPLLALRRCRVDPALHRRLSPLTGGAHGSPRWPLLRAGDLWRHDDEERGLRRRSERLGVVANP